MFTLQTSPSGMCRYITEPVIATLQVMIRGCLGPGSALSPAADTGSVEAGIRFNYSGVQHGGLIRWKAAWNQPRFTLIHTFP